MKVYAILLFITIETFGLCQKEFFKDRSIDIEFGVNIGAKNTSIEIGFNLFKEFTELSGHLYSSDALLLSSELIYLNNNLVLIPKISYSYNMIFLNFSGSLVNYNYNKLNEFYFRPAIGITLFGYADIVYGYNIPIHHSLEFVNTHTITLRGRLFGIFKNRVF